MSANQIIHKSARGKIVDMNKLIQQNEMTLAVGNARINARGDEIGPGGKIILKNEEYVPGTSTIAQVYHTAPATQTEHITAAPVQQPYITPTKQPKTPKIPDKDVSGMDPEGNE